MTYDAILAASNQGFVWLRASDGQRGERELVIYGFQSLWASIGLEPDYPAS